MVLLGQAQVRGEQLVNASGLRLELSAVVGHCREPALQPG
jgi:hypothetical protein